ncbi:hypothetical protein KIPB_007581 [Kipferlia bialata]|uniref:Uncharacterized protein n=1 Tax=Kipferlia bialata TaxID=797122 RepID=A0A9K3GK53_9EUKA|nr:hypothetical protein KIPB_007581 [Kipferlia bialata]|eukprot:g7581.t1
MTSSLGCLRLVLLGLAAVGCVACLTTEPKPNPFEASTFSQVLTLNLPPYATCTKGGELNPPGDPSASDTAA